jgi:hypothetical protein
MLSGVYADLKLVDPSSGLSIWLQSCQTALPTILRMLSSAGCDTSEIYIPSPNHPNEESYISGWNLPLLCSASCIVAGHVRRARDAAVPHQGWCGSLSAGYRGLHYLRLRR